MLRALMIVAAHLTHVGRKFVLAAVAGKLSEATVVVRKMERILAKSGVRAVAPPFRVARHPVRCGKPSAKINSVLMPSACRLERQIGICLSLGL